MAKFLEYVPGESFLHRMNPCVKLIGAVLIAIACFVTSNLVFLLILLAAALVMAASCGLGRETAGLCKAVFAFSLILAVVILLTTPHGMPLVPLLWGYIGTGSLLAALTVIVRLMAAAIPLFLVFYVTKMNDLTNAAVKQLHVPYKYAFTFTSTVHFIPVFMNDMAGIMEAQTARGVEFDGSFAKKVRLMIPLCVPLLVSSVRKTNSAAIAAEVRGFNLRTRTSGYKDYPLHREDFVALAVCVLVLAVGALGEEKLGQGEQGSADEKRDEKAGDAEGGADHGGHREQHRAQRDKRPVHGALEALPDGHGEIRRYRLALKLRAAQRAPVQVTLVIEMAAVAVPHERPPFRESPLPIPCSRRG